MDVKDFEQTVDKVDFFGRDIKFLKASDSLKHEFNRKLLVDLIIKKMKGSKDTYYSKAHLHSSAKLMIQDFVSRFKTLKMMYGQTNFLDNYEGLYQLVNGKEMEPKDNAAAEEIRSFKKKNKVDYKRYESLLMSKYVECVDDIKTRKEQIEETRRMNHQKSEQLVTTKQLVPFVYEDRRSDEEVLEGGRGYS